MRAVNPYIVGNPIKDQSDFFGRHDIFRDVMQILRQPGSNAIVLYGQRRIGKTSVLLQLEKQLVQAGEFTPVYFDLQDKAAKSLAEVLYELSQHISRVTGHTPARAADFDPEGDYFRRTFLPGVADKVASGGLVLLFDEFDVLDSPLRTQASEAFFPYLRRWMDDIQKIKFVFVIGRRPEDLSVRTMATFKGIQSTRVSFLAKRDAREVVLQSERDGSLQWEKETVEHVIGLTHGHPYFTQLLCSVIWENAYEDAPPEVPRISIQDVDAAIVPALKFGANAFNWIWDGLPPAERVVVAAMAEVDEEHITQERLIDALNSSGVRLVARELEFAPETLMDWEVLIASDGAYRFAVPLLRRWVLINRPLRRVKEELDRLNPLAESLYQSGQGFYTNNELGPAEQQLRQALNINPNHLKARLLLGQILLERHSFSESVAVFDSAYQYDERSARGDLIKALLALAETQEEDLQLSTYGRILSIQSEQPLATEKVRAIWVRRGEAAQAQENYEEAIRAFEQIGDSARIAAVQALMHEKRLALDMQRAEAYEKRGEWRSALDLLQSLTSEYPESVTLQSRMENARMNWRAESLRQLDAPGRNEDWARMVELCDALLQDFPEDPEIESRAEHARRQLRLTREYQEALEALRLGQNDKARHSLLNVLAENPSHLPAAHKLIEATYGEVRITRPVSWPVQLLVTLGSVFWSLLAFAFLGGLLWSVTRFGVLYLVEQGGKDYHVAAEAVMAGALLLAGLISFAVYSYAMKVMESASRLEQRGERSLGLALWTHVLFGMGLFYVDPNARRKWLYPVLAISIPLIILLGPLVLGAMYGELSRPELRFLGIYTGKEEKALIIWLLEGSQHIARNALGIALAGYLLSFVDVIATFYAKPRTSPAPSPKEWKQAFVVTRDTAAHVVSALKRFRRWLFSRTALQSLGLLSVLLAVFFVMIGAGAAVSGATLPWWFSVATVGFFGALLGWVIAAIIVVLQGITYVIRRGISKWRKASPTPAPEEPTLVSDAPADPTLKT